MTPPPAAVALPSIPAAEIEAVRLLKLVTDVAAVLMASNDHHWKETYPDSPILAARSFLARLQSPTSAGEGDTDAMAYRLFRWYYVNYDDASLEWCEKYWRECSQAEHAGDCPHAKHKAPITCDRCVCDEFRRGISDILGYGSTLPAVRRAVQAALGAGLCPEDAVVLGSWLRANGGTSGE